MASSSESDLLTSFEDVSDDMHEVGHQKSKGKEKMFDSCESSPSLEARESSSSSEEETDNKHVEWVIDANKNKVPELGQVFASEEEAYEFYNAYGQKEGFRVRRDRVERKRNGKMYVRRFTCSKEGHRRFDRRRMNVKKRHAERRTGCLSRMVIRLNDDDTWVVKEFVAEHNHPKAMSAEEQLSREEKISQPNNVSRIIDFADVGVSSADDIELMAKESRGEENHGTSELDFENFLPAIKRTKKNQVGKDEIQRLMDYFIRKQLENPSFFYAVQVNSVHEMTNFFWADARSIMDYGYFGDVVCFFTAYRTSKFSWPIASFIGVNHHRQATLFGAALLLEETADSFVWLFKTFLEAMSGRKPNTILTDQCPAIAKAINIVMPETHHRLCLWHIFQNATIYLPHVFKDPNFIIDFKKCIYNDETEEAFSLAWNQMLEKHSLVGDKWLEGLFEFRKMWALVFGRNTFYADMTTTQWSESINCMLKEFLERKLSLAEAVLCYEKVLATRRAKELKAEFDSSQTSPALYINAPMLKQLAKIYTQEVFEMFQKEFQQFLLYNVENCGVDGSVKKYKVTNFEGGEECLVTLDASNNDVMCSCKKFEFVGIQCKHVLKVLNNNNIHVLPSQYILKRWTKDARVGVVQTNVRSPIQVNPDTSTGSRYANICRMIVNLATRGEVSEDAHLVAINILEKALDDMDAIFKENQMTNSYNSIRKMNDGDNLIDVTLTLAQRNGRGRPSNARTKSCVIRGRGKEGKTVSVEGRNMDPLVNSICPEEIITQEPDNSHTFQEPFHVSGLQHPSFQSYLGVLPGSFPMPMSGMSIPSIAPRGGISTAHAELIRPTNSLGGHFPPPSTGHDLTHAGHMQIDMHASQAHMDWNAARHAEVNGLDN